MKEETMNKIYNGLIKTHLADHVTPLVYKILSDDDFKAVEIETTTSCNRRCSICPNSVYNRGDYLMDTGLFFKIIDELSEHDYNGRISPHFYGEPLLDKRLPVFLEYIKNKLPNSETILYTNGDLLTKEYYDIIEDFVDKIKLTLYNDSNRDKCFPKVEFKTLGQTGITNRGGLMDNGCDYSVLRCYKPFWTIVVDYQGNVILCCNDYHSSVVFGNLLHQKLYDIWDSYSDVRRDIFNGVMNFDICKNCKVRDHSWDYKLTKENNLCLRK